MTDDQTEDAGAGWSSMAAAGALIGLSELGFWRLARAEGFEVRQRDNRPEVRQADVEAYLRRSHPHPAPSPSPSPPPSPEPPPNDE